MTKSVATPLKTRVHARPLFVERKTPKSLAASSVVDPTDPALAGWMTNRETRAPPCQSPVCTNTSAPNCSQVAPPFRERSTPHPYWPTGSPVPAYTMSGLTGSMTMDPMDTEHSLSVRGVHDAPALSDLQTPP